MSTLKCLSECNFHCDPDICAESQKCVVHCDLLKHCHCIASYCNQRILCEKSNLCFYHCKEISHGHCVICATKENLCDESNKGLCIKCCCNYKHKHCTFREKIEIFIKTGLDALERASKDNVHIDPEYFKSLCFADKIGVFITFASYILRNIKYSWRLELNRHLERN